MSSPRVVLVHSLAGCVMLQFRPLWLFYLLSNAQLKHTITLLKPFQEGHTGAVAHSLKLPKTLKF